MILSSDLNFPEKTSYSYEKTISVSSRKSGEKGKAKITFMAGPILANKTGYDPKCSPNSLHISDFPLFFFL